MEQPMVGQASKRRQLSSCQHCMCRHSGTSELDSESQAPVTGPQAPVTPGGRPRWVLFSPPIMRLRVAYEKPAHCPLLLCCLPLKPQTLSQASPYPNEAGSMKSWLPTNCLFLFELLYYLKPSPCSYGGQRLASLSHTRSPSHLAVSFLLWVSAIFSSLAPSQLFYQNHQGSRLFYLCAVQKRKQSQACSQFDRLQV